MRLGDYPPTVREFEGAIGAFRNREGEWQLLTEEEE